MAREVPVWPEDIPQPPPEAVLIRLAREARGIKIPAAAKAAGISKARWSQVETGYEMRRGRRVPVAGRAGTIAHMAHAVGITPVRLESEGQRADAAAVLAEIARDETESARDAGAQPAATASGDDPVLAWVRSLPGLSPAQRESLEGIARPRGALDVNMRRGVVGWVLTMWAQEDQAQNRSA